MSGSITPHTALRNGGELMSPSELQTHGARKYPTSALLKSSAGLGWSTVSAELRTHGISETAVIVPLQTELTIAVLGNEHGLVRRSGAGQQQQARPITGTIWMTPIGVGDNEISITAPIRETLHLYLPKALFSRLADDFNLPRMPVRSLRYMAGVRDEIVNQIGLSILASMTDETAAGRMFVETASLTLAARLVHKYCDSGSFAPSASTGNPADHIKLRRVLDYISDHLADDITLADLARVAGFSPFHFARAFTTAIGIPPHRYVSRLRLENAMAEIAGGKLPLMEIALNARCRSMGCPSLRRICSIPRGCARPMVPCFSVTMFPPPTLKPLRDCAERARSWWGNRRHTNSAGASRRAARCMARHAIPGTRPACPAARVVARQPLWRQVSCHLLWGPTQADPFVFHPHSAVRQD
jgi:AraC family transcriptional regulator